MKFRTGGEQKLVNTYNWNLRNLTGDWYLDCGNMEGCGNAKYGHYHSLIFFINVDLHFPNMWFLRHQRWVFVGHIRFASSGVAFKKKKKKGN